MSRPYLHSRLVALVGDEQAFELLEAPNALLGGRTPQELIDRGNTAPVEVMIREMEAHAGVSKVSPRLGRKAPVEIDGNAADPIHDRIPQRRHTRGSGRIFRILEQLERGGSR